MSRDEWLRTLFACIDRKESAQFVEFLTPDGLFRYGSSPAVIGRDAIFAAVDQVFATIRSSSHRLLRTFQEPGSVICQGEVTYTLHDGRQFVVPFCNVFALEGEKISSYEIYIDPTPLLAPAAAA